MSVSPKITINNILISPSSLFYEKMGARRWAAGLRAHERRKTGAPRGTHLARFLFLGEILC
jgi:hypothetical protein